MKAIRYIVLVVALTMLAGAAYAQAPSIIAQPASQSSAVGGTIQFTVSATGGGTLVYQWRKNSTNLANGTFSGRATVSGATTTAMTLAGVTTNDQANYTCYITNTSGSITSSVASLDIIVAPAITTQPKSLVTNVGATVSFSVVASGTAPLSYQWYDNDSPISGATLNAYTISGVFTSDAGTYNVRVSNAAGTATSSNAVLTVGNPPVLTLQPTSLIVSQGATASFSASASGDQPMYYFWRKSGAAISGATNTNYSIASALPSDAATYSFVASNSVGMAVSTGALLTVYYSPTITTQPVGGTFGVNSSFTVNVGAVANPISYQWRLNGSPISSAINSNYTVDGAQTTNAGNYDVIISNFLGSVTSSVAVVSVIYYPPVITAQPVGGNLLGGVPYSVGVSAIGSALAYQWLKNGNALPGANGSTLALPDLCINDSGNYSVTITNPLRSVTSSVATLSVHYIYKQPTGGNALAGNNFTFNVGAQGTGLTYQWQKNGINISNANSTYLPLTNPALADAGNYTVVVTNYNGSETSTAAALYVGYAPFITQQPSSTTNAFGGTAVFSCAASGPLPMNYQWLHNNTILAGQTGAMLTLPNLQLQNVGTYNVIIGNNFGGITSSIVVLHLSPGMIAQPTNQIVMPVSAASFTALAGGEPPLCYQWQFNGTNLEDNTTYFGSASNTVSLVAALTNTVGNYALVVSNPYGSITSTVATLSFGFQAISTFVFTGLTSSYVVPAGISNLGITISGASGGDGQDASPGDIMLASGAVNVIPGQSFSVAVGSGGGGSYSQYSQALGVNPVAAFNGGNGVTRPNNYPCGGGGAATLVITPSEDYIIVGGSGGAAADGYSGNSSQIVSAMGVVGVDTFGQNGNTNQGGGGGGGGAVGGAGGIYGGGDGGASYLPINQLYETSKWSFMDGGLQVSGFGLRGNDGFIVFVPNGFPVIAQDLVSQSILVATSASLSLGVTSPVPLSYQWYENGINIVNVTNSVLTLNSVTPQDSGSYSVVASNAFGMVTSSVVTLTVNVPSYITSEPQSQSVLQGANANFSVVATGDPPLAYQWYLQVDSFTPATSLNGQTNANLNIINANIDDSGHYFVVVTNNYGTVTSTVAALVVEGLPQNLYITVEDNQAVQLQFTGTPDIPYVLQSATSLNPPVAWQSIITNLSDGNGNWTFVDTNAINYPAQFYRLQTH